MDEEAPKSSAALLTCIACKQVFEDLDELKVHYSSEWHRNNLLLKVGGYPPRTQEEFEIAMLKIRPAPKVEPVSLHCDVCQKVFKTQNAYDNHLGSKKHKDNEKKLPDSAPKRDNKTSEQSEAHPEADEVETDDEIEEVDSDEWDDDSNPINNNDCMFCLHHSKNFAKNFRHMATAHSFFIPDVDYCVDIEGLMRYLGKKISESFLCLWCNDKGKSFRSADAARNHMKSAGHTMMIYEGLALAEYADFYDYSSSYPEKEGTEEDEEEEEATIPDVGGSEYQLVLPSGITIGHRSLMRYYKQSIDPARSQALVVSNNAKKLHKVLAQYRSLGWTQSQQEEAARRAKDIHYMKRKMSKLNLKLGVQGNKIHMKHFRSQNP